jgi:hypothetical protein
MSPTRRGTRAQQSREDTVDANLSQQVHLVGSIGLDTVEDVFRDAGKRLGKYLRRIPDGEPGGRRLWISWQYPLLRSNPFLRPDPSGAKRPTTGFPLLCLGEGVNPSELRFGELGYAREARASYLDFCVARERGELPRHLKFQVCLPTPMGVAYSFCTQRDLGAIEPAYEQAMLREAEAFCRHIPHRDLCIQWDFCNEMVLIDGQPQEQFPTIKASTADIMERMQRLCAPIPETVELGIHLCYGDFGAKHFIEPIDASRMVEAANGLARSIKRRLDYIHMPVPMSRTDDAFFSPLRELALAPETEVYLGVVARDGAEATQRRIAAASRYVPKFGIATECGMARARTPDLVLRLLDIHAEVAHDRTPTA